MKKKCLALLLTLSLLLSLLPATALAVGEVVTATVTMNTQSIADDVTNYGLDALPSTAQVTVPAGSKLSDVMLQWKTDKDVYLIGADTGYITYIGDFGPINDLCTAAGLENTPAEFQYAGWMYTVNGKPDNNGISGTEVKAGDVIDFRYTVYFGAATGGEWKAFDWAFLDAYNGLTELITQAEAAEQGNFTAEQWTTLQTALRDGSAAKTAVYEEAAGMWLNYFAEKKTSLWGPGSPTDKLENAKGALSRALNKVVTPTGITFESNNIELPLNRTVQLVPTVGPEGASQDVTYKAWIGEDCFTVSADGLVTPSKKNSMCWVKVACKDMPSVSEWFKFKIVDAVAEDPDYSQRLTALSTNIAASYIEKSDEWSVISMGMYETAFPGGAALTAAKRQEYLNKAIESLSGGTPDDSTVAKAILGLRSLGYDPETLTAKDGTTKLNAVDLLKKTTTTSLYNAPYVLLAYQQGAYDEAKELAVRDLILGQQSEDGSWMTSADTTGLVLTVLADYAGDATVNTAIAKGVAFLKDTIGETGCYHYGSGSDNADSTAMAVVGLAAAGEDLTQVKHANGTGILQGLLSFALADNSGFGYTNNQTLSPFATKDGFWAVLAAVKGDGYRLFDFTRNAKLPAVATPEEGGSEGGETPTPPDETMSVFFTLKTHNTTWVPKKTVTVAKNATVGDTFKKAVEGTGVTYVDSSGYISSITYNGTTLGELTEGPKSGWKYMVNETAPDVGMNDKTLAEGDDLVWYYVTDYTQDTDRDEGATSKPTQIGTGKLEAPASGAVTDKMIGDALSAAGETVAEIVITAPAGKQSIALSAASVETLFKAGKGLAMETETAGFSLDATALHTLVSATGEVKMTIQPVETTSLSQSVRAKLGAGARVFDFVVTAGGKTISNLGGGKAVLSLPGVLSEGQKAEFLRMVYVDESGDLHLIGTTYSTKSKTVLGNTPHLSQYAVTYLPFTDVADDWFFDSVLYAYHAGLFGGVGDEKFAPEAPMTRGMVTTVLYRLSGDQVETAEGAWYARGLDWAKEKQISDGSNPEGTVTREQLATMLFRYAGSPTVTGGTAAFADAGDISAFAADAMNWAVERGILQGADGKLNPTATATRAEVAAMLLRFTEALA